MQVQVGDRLVLHGHDGTRIGVVVEAEEGGGSRVHWADGGETVLSAVPDGSGRPGHAAWEAAKVAPAVTWRRGVVAGVGREASLAQAKLPAGESVAPEVAVEPVAAEEHDAQQRPAAGE